MNAVTISLSTNRNNLFYTVVKGSGEVREDFNWMIEELRNLGSQTPKKIVYCQSIDHCSSLYCHFDITLMEKGYCCEDRKVRNCFFAMFHAKITDELKSTIMHSFSDPNGNCRILFATVAFGMGVNIPNVRMVVHYGPSHNVDEYVQECGCGGRDGEQSQCILYWYPGCTRRSVSNDMKIYVKNSSVCRRHLLSSIFQETSCPQKFRTCVVISVSNPAVVAVNVLIQKMFVFVQRSANGCLLS